MASAMGPYLFLAYRAIMVFLQRMKIKNLVLVLSLLCGLTGLLPLWAQPLQQNTQVLDKIIAKVDNQIVLQSELELAYLTALQGTEKVKGDLRCKVLETLVVNKLLLAKAELDSVTVESKMVDDNLNRRMSYMIATVGGKEKLESYYGKTVEQFKSELRKQVKEQMIVQKMQENITKDIKVLPSEVRKFFSLIPKDSLPYFSKEVEVGQIVRFGKIPKNRRMDARDKAAKLKERILKGEKFDDLARIYSDDPGSATNGGELGYWGRNVMASEFEATALRLKKGEISDPVETQFGWHIIELLDRRGEEFNSRHILIKPVSSGIDLTETKAYLDSLKEAILDDSISWERAAKLHSEDNLTKGSGGMFIDQSTNTSRIPLEEVDPVIYFMIDTMVVGQISEPVKYRSEDGKEGMRILYYRNYYPPHEANLRDDYQKIQNAALNKKKAEALNKWFEKTKGEVYINVDKAYQTCKLLE